MALTIAALGLVAAAFGVGLVLVRTTSAPDGYSRVTVPGSVVVELPARTVTVVYFEGGRVPTTDLVPVAVTAPDGTPVGVRDLDQTLEYDRQGGVGRGFASFTTSEAGLHTVTVDAPAGISGVAAVGPHIAIAAWDGLRPPLALASTALTLAAFVVVGSALRSSRRTEGH